MRWSKYAQITLSIDRPLFASESDAKFIHGQVSFVEVRHGLYKSQYLCNPKLITIYNSFGVYILVSRFYNPWPWRKLCLVIHGVALLLAQW